MENRLNTSCDVRLWANAQRIKKDGTTTIYIRIKVQRGGVIFIQTGISWPFKNFDKINKALRNVSLRIPKYS